MTILPRIKQIVQERFGTFFDSIECFFIVALSSISRGVLGNEEKPLVLALQKTDGGGRRKPTPPHSGHRRHSDPSPREVDTVCFKAL